MARILTVDDNHASCQLVRAIFEDEGFEVLLAHDGPAGLASVTRDRPDVVLLDLDLPGLHGLDVLGRVREADAQLPVVMLTANAEVKSAVRATQLGATDYLVKPVDPDEVRRVVRRALENRALRAEVQALRRQLAGDRALAQQMGPSAQVARVVEQVQTVAGSNFSVLLLGETGTGKELVAQAIHRQSERAARPFVALDCGAIPEALLESELFGHERGAFTGADRRRDGHFRLAEGGTLFLDEVGNLPLALQAKLLRVLESRQIQAVGGGAALSLDVRFVAATNDDLLARAQAGAFRPDLYFRLAQYTITLPSLRARLGDVPHLAQRFVEEVSVELRKPVHGLAPEALALLAAHPWPGNVRELRNVIRQAVLEAKALVVGPDGIERHLVARAASAPVAPASPREASAGPRRSLKAVADEAARAAERAAITEVLRETGGNKSEAARALRTDYKTLHVKMKGLGIDARDFEA